VVVEQGGQHEAGVRLVVVVEPRGEGRRVHPATRKPLAHVVGEVEIEDGVDATA